MHQYLDPWVIGLIAVNAMVLVLLAIAVMRHRQMRFAADEERRNNFELIENLSEGIYRSSIDGRQLSANPALVQLNGYASEKEQLDGVRDIAREWYVDPQRRSQFRALLDRDGKVENFISEVYRHKTRERIWITESARLVYDRKSGKALFYEGSVREITETVKRLDLEAQFQKLTHRLPVGLFHFVRRPNETFEVRYLSQAASRISGIPVQEQISDPAVFNDLVVADDRDSYLEAFAQSSREIVPWDCEFRINARDGVEKWVHINTHTEAAGAEIHWYGSISDISVRKRQEMEIQQLAYFDPLTKLPNRRMFFDRIMQTVDHCGRTGGYASLLFIDLDNFKTLNDTRGHDVGDHLLVQVASRLRKCVAGQDLVARMGGDEFVAILSPDGTDRPLAALRAVATANRILMEMQSGFDLDCSRYVGSASIGIVVFDGAHRRGEEILKRADIAMYQAKAAGRNSMSIYEPRAEADISADLVPVADRRTA